MATSVQDFVGTFSLDRHNSGDLGAAHLSLAGVNMIKRAMLTKLSVDVNFSLEGDVLVEHVMTTFVNKTVKYNLGGEPTKYYDDAFAVNFSRFVKFENGKLTSEIKEEKGRFVINDSRYLSDDKKIMYHDATLTYGGKTAESNRQFVRK